MAGSVAALAAATGLIYALRPIAPVLSLGVLYVLAVLITAIVWGAAYAVPVAVASMLAFNFFFLPPLLTFRLADGRNWTALAVYVATAVIVSELATRARGRAAEAEQRGRETALLSDAAAELLQVGDTDALLGDLQARVDRVLVEADAVARERFEAAFETLVATARERERLEGDARDAEALRRSDVIKTALLQAISHDFRTPLATMAAAVGGLESGDLHALRRGPRRAARDDPARARAHHAARHEPARLLAPAGRRGTARMPSCGRSTTWSARRSTRSPSRSGWPSRCPPTCLRCASTRSSCSACS